MAINFSKLYKKELNVGTDVSNVTNLVKHPFQFLDFQVLFGSLYASHVYIAFSAVAWKWPLYDKSATT